MNFTRLSRGPLVDAVVVTHNSADVVEATLRTLATASLELPLRTWVVDNASSDGSERLVRTRCCWATSVALATNVGFGAGCNVGANLGHAPYVLLLNPDCELQPGALLALVQHLEAHPRAAAVGAIHVDRGGRMQPSYHAFPSLRGELVRTFERAAALLGWVDVTYRPPASGPVDWTSGACMLVRRSALETIGPFDERFFLYYEETDWCRRARAHGYEVHLEPAARVLHAGGTSVARSAVGRGRRRADGIFRESRRRYFRKHHGRLTMALVEGLHLVRRLVDRLRPARLAGAAR